MYKKSVLHQPIYIYIYIPYLISEKSFSRSCDKKHHFRYLWTMIDSFSPRPRCHVVLYCAIVLQLVSQICAFTPHLRQRTYSLSSVKSSIQVEPHTADKWLKEQIEYKQVKEGPNVIDDTCVIGPKHVLIYDTTLRGSYATVDYSTTVLIHLVCYFSLALTLFYTLPNNRRHAGRICVGLMR